MISRNWGWGGWGGGGFFWQFLEIWPKRKILISGPSFKGRRPDPPHTPEKVGREGYGGGGLWGRGGLGPPPDPPPYGTLPPHFPSPRTPTAPRRPSLTPAVTSQQRPREAGWGNLTDSGPELARNFAARPRAGPGPDFGASSRNQGGGPRSSRRRVFGCPDRVFLRRFRAQTGRENRPFAPIGGGPSQPISGRRVNLGFRDTSSGGIGKSEFGAPSKIHWGGHRSFRRRAPGRPDRAFYRRPRAQTGFGNRPSARAGGGPSFGTILTTGRPISGRRVNPGSRGAFSGKSESRSSGPRREFIGGA